MARYRLSQVNGSSLAFNARTDTLLIDLGSAADLSIEAFESDLILRLGDGSVTLRSLSLGLITTTNVLFANGSRLLIGDNTTNPDRDARDNVLRGTDGNDHLLGLGGNDTLFGGQGNDRLDGGDGDDTLNGQGGADTIDAGDGADIISGGAGNDSLFGGAGDDRISGGSGNDSIDGGSGRDVAVYAGTRASYSIVQDGGIVQVRDLARNVNGDDGTDTLRNVEVLRFLDGEVVLASPADADAGAVNSPGAPQAVTEVQTPAQTAASNLPPSAADDQVVVSEDGGAVRIDVLANDTDQNAGDLLTVTSVDGSGTPPTVRIVFATGGGGAPVVVPGIPAVRGTVSVAPDQLGVVYSPGDAFQFLKAGITATDSFAYTMADGAGAQSTARVTVTVTGVNDGPVAVADSASLGRNAAPAFIDVLANDIDADAGDTKRVVSVDGAGLLGTVTTDGSGVVYSTGDAFQGLALGATATETFSYTMEDSAGARSTALVTVTVIGVNNVPVAVGDSASATEDGGPVVIDVLANDTDADFGDSKTVVAVTSAGLLGTVATDGSVVVYSVGDAFQSLREGATAEETFSYTMADALGEESTANVTVTVTGVNDSPLARADNVTVSEDAGTVPIAVLANDTDVDAGDTKNVVSVDGTGLKGTVTVAADGSRIFYSVGNVFQGLAAGETGTETFSYTMADGAGAHSTASVTVTVTGADDGAVAVPDGATVSEDGESVAIDVLANDLNDGALRATQTVTAVDGNGSPPIFISRGGIQGNEVGILIPAFPATRGTVSVAQDGLGVIYTAGEAFQYLRAGESDSDFFKYTIRDSTGSQSTAAVEITVTGENDAPVALDDSATLAFDAGPLTIDVLANDTDADLGDTRKIVSVNGDSINGRVEVAADGLGLVYSVGDVFPALPFGETAIEIFSYTMVDGSGAESTAAVTVTVTGVNSAPTAVADTAVATEDGPPVVIDVLANDTDADFGDTKTVASVNAAALQGTVTHDGASIIYTVGAAFQALAAGATAVETFSYTMADALGAESTANVTVTVTGVNDNPVAAADSLLVSEDAAPVTIAVLANDFDADAGDTRTVVSVDGTGLQGAVAVAPGGGGVVYTVGAAFQALNLGQTATETFSYTMADGGGAQSTANVTVTVVGANEPPPPGSIFGTSDDDIITTGDAADTIFGLGGDDEISSAGGADALFGGAGRDTLDGGDGDDVLVGGSDRDDLTGGAGADVFRFDLVSDSTALAADRIRDFDSAEGDRLDLHLIDANTAVAGDNAFTLSAGFTGMAGQLVLVAVGTNLQVQGDVNGDAVADFLIELRNVTALESADFLL